MIKLENIGGLPLRSWFLIILIGILFLYLSGTTKSILNFNNETKTVMYPEQCFIPPAEITQEYVNLCSIPKNNVNQNHLIMGFSLLFLLVATLLTEKSKVPEMANFDEAEKIVKNHLQSHKEIQLDTGEIISVGKFNISTYFLLPEERIGKDRIPERYVLDILITDIEDMEHNVRGYVHPFKRYMKGFVSADKPLEETDRCSNCGKEFDVEYVDTEDYKKFKRIKSETKD